MENKENKSMKKGFTLIELIAVFLVLGIILLITFPLVTKYLEQGEEKLDQETEISIKNASNVYVSEFSKELEWKYDDADNKVTCISIESLIDKGIIKENEKVTPYKEKYTIKSTEVNGVATNELVEKKECNLDDYDSEKQKDLPLPKLIDYATRAGYTTIEISVTDAIVEGSEVKDYYYKINDGEYQKSDKNTYTFEDLEVDSEYKVYVYVTNENDEPSEVLEKTVRTLMPKSTLQVNASGGTWQGNTITQNIENEAKTRIEIANPEREAYFFKGWEEKGTNENESMYGQLNQGQNNSIYTYGSENDVTDIITAKWQHAAARIGSIYYETVQEAFDAVAKDNNLVEVYLLDNRKENTKVEANKNIRLVGQTYTLTGKMEVEGKLEIKTGTIDNEEDTITVMHQGSLTLTSGTIKSEKGNAIVNNSTGAITVKGGTITSTGSDAIVINLTGAITIGGGSVSAPQGIAIKQNSNSTVTINKGTVNGGTYGIYATTTNKVYLKGGNVIGKDYGIYMATSSHSFYFHGGAIFGNVKNPFRGNNSRQSNYYISITSGSDYSRNYKATVYYNSPSSSGGDGDDSWPWCSCSGVGCADCWY